MVQEERAQREKMPSYPVCVHLLGAVALRDLLMCLDVRVI